MKLLVTTDFSANSKSAVRFAQTLSTQSKNIHVTFYHAVQILKPTVWNETFFEDYQSQELSRFLAELKKFVNASIGEGVNSFASVKYVIEKCISTENNIVQYAEKNKFNFICIATRGAGLLRKIMGTHTSYLVNNSKIPLLVIPSHYKAKPINKATYLSDFQNLKKEAQQVSKFSTQLSLQVEVLHYSSVVIDKKQFEKNIALFKTAALAHFKLNIQKNNLEHSLIDRVSKYVQKEKPQLLVMFTKREKSFFERIFLPSKSAELTYTTKVPVLIFSK